MVCLRPKTKEGYVSMSMNSDAQDGIQGLLDQYGSGITVTRTNQGRRVVFAPASSQSPFLYSTDADEHFGYDQEQQLDNE